MIVLLSTYVSSGHTLADADAAAQKAGACLCIDVNYTLTANITLSAPYLSVAGGIITRGAFSLWVNSVFTGSDYDQLTEPGGSGTVRFARQRRISIRWFGGILNGTIDDTKAFQATINAAGTNGVVYLTEGVLRLSSGVTVATDGTRIEGASKTALQIRLYPTAPMVALTFSKGKQVIYRNAVVGVSFYSSDLTFQKVAIDAYDCSELLIEDVYISGAATNTGTGFFSNNSGTAGTSVGLRTHGRELLQTERLTIFADMPIQICKNPNTPPNILEDMDHGRFAGLYLGANGNPHITIDPDAGLSNVEFEASQAWVLGTYGVYCKSTFPSMMYNVAFRNFRTEQGTDKNAWSVYLDCGQGGISNVTFDNAVLEPGRNGIFLRGVRRTLLQSCLFMMTNAPALDTTAGPTGTLTAINCLADPSATVTTTNMVRLESIDNGSQNPIANNAEYVYWNGNINTYPSLHLAENARQFSWTGPLANGASLSLPISTGGNAMKMGRGFIQASAKGVDANSVFFVSVNGLNLINPTANFVTAPAPGMMALEFNGGFPLLLNNLGADVELNIQVDWRT